MVLFCFVFVIEEKNFDSYHENSYEVRLVKQKAGTSFGNASLLRKFTVFHRAYHVEVLEKGNLYVTNGKSKAFSVHFSTSASVLHVALNRNQSTGPKCE